ncbi:hypothetical protein B0H14DRAFT_2563415 [Mycena olivaceomarginata]|nr:hypothetical protein B0H14DRAFT_2563415 [Mycena olivaceomarginata]
MQLWSNSILALGQWLLRFLGGSQAPAIVGIQLRLGKKKEDNYIRQGRSNFEAQYTVPLNTYLARAGEKSLSLEVEHSLNGLEMVPRTQECWNQRVRRIVEAGTEEQAAEIVAFETENTTQQPKK